jgi:hypothetical protein
MSMVRVCDRGPLFEINGRRGAGRAHCVPCVMRGA